MIFDLVPRRETSSSSSNEGCLGALFSWIFVGVGNFLLLVFIFGPLALMFDKPDKYKLTEVPLGFIPSSITAFYQWIGNMLASIPRFLGNCVSSVWNNQITPFPNLNLVIAIVLLGGTVPLVYWVGRKIFAASSFRRSAVYILALLYIPWAIYVVFLLAVLIICAGVAIYGWLFSK